VRLLALGLAFGGRWGWEGQAAGNYGSMGALARLIHIAMQQIS
jgi:hypothetical protein